MTSFQAFNAFIRKMTPFEVPEIISGEINRENTAALWKYPGGHTSYLEFFSENEVYYSITSNSGAMDGFGGFDEVAEITGEALLRHVEGLSGEDLEAWKAIEEKRA